MREADEGAPPFWERPEQVERFAERAPDRRLAGLLDRFPEPGGVRVLDLGCAGGRNAELLARRGFDLRALDASEAMVRRTRERVARILGPREASRRVRRGRMEDLGRFADDTFDLVVALGVYHNAGSRQAWDRSVAETARVLARGGLLLTSDFSPRSEPRGEPLRRLGDSSHRYEGFASGPLFLLEAAALDREMARHGLFPAAPTEAVRVPTDEGHRVTVNGLYRKDDGPRAGGGGRASRSRNGERPDM